jgi:hypothetical protein
MSSIRVPAFSSDSALDSARNGLITNADFIQKGFDGSIKTIESSL